MSVGLAVLGQVAPADSVKAKHKLRPYEVKVGFNFARALRSAIEKDYSSQELTGLVSFDSYVFYLDYGFQKTDRSSDDADYHYMNNGSFYRLGISKNFIKNKVGGNTISIGARYARSSFKDELAYTVNDFFGEQPLNLENPNLTARWFELVFDMKGRVAANLFLGLTTRWQFLRKINGAGQLQPYDVPGFGTTQRPNSTAFDYYVTWRIPLD